MNQKAVNRWGIVGGGFVIIMGLGVAYAWGVFLGPISAEFGWGRGETSLALSVLLFVFSIFMVVGGSLEKKYGPRKTATVGGLFICAGWILGYFTQSLMWLYLSYGVLCGIGTGLGYLPSISTGIKWFPDKRGMITGIVVFGFGFGSAFLAPLATRFIEAYGWRMTMLIYGCSFGVLIVGAAQFLKNPPDNWMPDGWEEVKQNVSKKINFSYKEMLKTSTFKVMFFTYTLSMIAGMMTIGHVVSFVEDKGFSALQAAFALTILSIGNGAGRIISGIISDKIGRKKTLMLIFNLIGITMLVLYYLDPLVLIYLAAGSIGFCCGGFLAVYPPATADFFGPKYFGLNYGLLFIGYGVGCFLGPWFGGLVYDITGSYLMAFNVAGILALLGGITVHFFLKPPVESK